MATFLRPLSYRYQWLYDAVARLTALSVGGEARFRQLALAGLPIEAETQVLDLCCGSGQTTQFLVQRSRQVTGLDASPQSLDRAKQNVPEAAYEQGWAEDMSFPPEQFDLVHTSVAMHEMAPQQRHDIFKQVFRVLKPGGYFALIDFHSPTNPLFWPGLAAFLWLFETETAWQLIQTDLTASLSEVGFQVESQQLHAGGSLQVIQSRKPAPLS